MKFLIPVLLILALTGVPVLAQELTADQILTKADDVVNQPKSMICLTTLTVKEAGKPDKVRQIKVWQSQGQRMVKFTQPASEVGIGLLSPDSSTNYVYMPAYDKVRRIASHVRNQTFMGTDLSQEDMATNRYSKEYSAKLLSQASDAWVLELTRKPGSSAGYGKLVTTISKDHFLFSQIDYYDDKGTKIKVEKRANPQQYNGKYWIMDQLVVTSVKDNHQTLLKMSDFKFDEVLPADFFTERTLKRPVQ